MTATANAPAAPSQATPTPSVKPRYSVDGSKEAYELRIEMPGVPKEGVSIDLDQNVLTVRGQRRSKAPSQWKNLHKELNDFDFVLRLRLNAPVDEGRLAATMECGVLQVRLPVAEEAKPRRIEIQ